VSSLHRAICTENNRLRKSLKRASNTEEIKVQGSRLLVYRVQRTIVTTDVNAPEKRRLQIRNFDVHYTSIITHGYRKMIHPSPVTSASKVTIKTYCKKHARSYKNVLTDKILKIKI
jgi:hypothetical protein